MVSGKQHGKWMVKVRLEIHVRTSLSKAVMGILDWTPGFTKKKKNTEGYAEGYGSVCFLIKLFCLISEESTGGKL